MQWKRELSRPERNMGLIDPGGVAHPSGVSQAQKAGHDMVQTLRLGPRRLRVVCATIIRGVNANHPLSERPEVPLR